MAERTRKFVASGDFAELPTRSEEIQANEDTVDVPVSVPEEPDRAEPEHGSPETEDTAPALETPEERKVRRARARAAYAAAQTPAQPAVDTMDTRA